MPSTFFISDLHLDAARPATTAALADFLAVHAGCEALYILGDLFEAWVGDDDDAPLVAEVRQMLARFSAAGPALFIMQGNRDFLLGEQYCRSAGATLLEDPTVIDLYDEPTLLLHGDSLCTGDAEYQAFRKTARDRAWQAELLARPLAERRALAAQLRGMSREANSNKAEDIMDVAPAAVAQAMGEYGVRQMIHGHTHRPARHAEPGGTRWVLGDWCEKGWAIEAGAEGLELYNFAI
jgi:UDP-2,3-diacylglucosamine hydrolase